jgi:NhaA family Na+:H+ antiporter
MDRLRSFFASEAAGGVWLLAAAFLAIVSANGPLAPVYERLLTVPLGVSAGDAAVVKPLLLWINDGLMAVFFLHVALEVKRELLEGALSSRQRLALPGIAALGGMAVPALIYSLVTWSDPVALSGWAIPAATDIAFALGVLALLGRRVPASLKIFLLTLAVVDDMGAVVIIALFYTSSLAPASLLLGTLAMAVLMIMNRLGVRGLAPYVLVGIAGWFCVLQSGVHATLAGVMIGFAIPHRLPGETGSPLLRMEHGLKPWVMLLILPVFAFANAGISFDAINPAALSSPVTVGIVLGLFLGKQLGVMGFAWASVRLGAARLPDGADWRHVYGVALLTGIGFTMSLFIASLAFEGGGGAAVTDYRLGILLGSFVSAVSGYVVLRAVSAGRSRDVTPGAAPVAASDGQ